MDDLVELILVEVLKDTERMMWKIARTTRIPGYDPDDLMQEMRIKIWETIKNNKYDPELVKPTSFYYRVCKNHLINLNASKIYQYKATKGQERNFRDCLDENVDDLDHELNKNGSLSPDFVRNFSKEFIKDYFQLVLLDDELQALFGEPDEKSGNNQIENSTRNTEYQEQV